MLVGRSRRCPADGCNRFSFDLEGLQREEGDGEDTSAALGLPVDAQGTEVEGSKGMGLPSSSASGPVVASASSAAAESMPVSTPAPLLSISGALVGSHDRGECCYRLALTSGADFPLGHLLVQLAPNRWGLTPKDVRVPLPGGGALLPGQQVQVDIPLVSSPARIDPSADRGRSSPNVLWNRCWNDR